MDNTKVLNLFRGDSRLVVVTVSSERLFSSDDSTLIMTGEINFYDNENHLIRKTQ